MALLQPVTLPPISTLPEKDEAEPEQQEPEPEQQELEPWQHEPDYGRDKLNQQFKSCMRNFNENVLKWHVLNICQKNTQQVLRHPAWREPRQLK